ncbi:tRNA-guanine(15) transglycosylase-like [Dillenia turbinata]|uniref:Queuine tRNA-ribosyltransferase accessory subunit 2 n=1 Tax=Dillenia turbinata TaxID=194707 RepID=A0AAN8ZH04_9MAGN
MKFAVQKAWSNSGRARVGVLEFGSNHKIETPSLLLSTRKGLPLFISPDLLSSLPFPDSHLLQVSPFHFLEGISAKTISDVGGLHDVVGLNSNDYGLVAVPRDSLVSLPDCDGSNKFGASFETPGGRRLIKPSDYMNLINSMKPNLWVTLADEVPAWVSQKRNKISVDRTITWLDQCLSAQNPSNVVVLGPIVGGSDVEERRRCAVEVSRRNVFGYWIGGFGLGESRNERSDLLSAITDHLPEEKLRQICGLELPEEVLQGVAAGVDLFDSTYIYHLTLGGFGLSFPLERRTRAIEKDVAIEPIEKAGSDQTKINLRHIIHRKDMSPIVEDCACYTCRNHTKAYINHLLNVHEMLAQILLEIHNTHHYLAFFRKIREAIKAGEFEEFHAMFVKNRREHLAVSSVCA